MEIIGEFLRLWFHCQDKPPARQMASLRLQKHQTSSFKGMIMGSWDCDAAWLVRYVHIFYRI